MTDVDELISSVITVDDGIGLIADLEKKITLVRENKKDTSSQNIPALLDDFKSEFYKLQVVSLTLAIEPSREMLVKLKNWFAENLGQGVVFDLQVDPQIIGGVKIICRNHFRDFSLSGVIKDVTKREFIREEAADRDSEMMPSVLI